MKKLKFTTKTAIALSTMLVAVIFCGCEMKNVQTEYTATTIAGREIKIYIIDSCEYIGNIYSSRGDVFTHKGNCKFCAERSKK